MKAEVLIVDDDASLRRALADRIAFWGHHATEAKDGEEAIAVTEKREFDLILLDMKMPGLSGLQVVEKLKAQEVTADVVMLTAHGSVEGAVSAIRAGATDFLLKPADFDVLQTILERSLHKRSLTRVNKALRGQLESVGGFFVGTSEKMKSLLADARQAAQSNATILLTGESGSGKQVMSEYIHRESQRKDGPFVYVNCVALTDTLVESTLFGHERGAFTGADRRREGRLEMAAGGTAFLDEIGDISPNLQTKLLHFLETGEFERLGGSKTLKVDCRIIAATNRDLPAAIRDGNFREDLYYRLNVVHFQLPPLRERPEDIPLLAERILERLSKELKREDLSFSKRTLELIGRYRWPGNVRQLKNAVERMAVLARTSTLTPDLLPPEVFGDGGQPVEKPGDLSLKEAMQDFKRRYIRQALARTGGNQKAAAEALGVQRTYLNRVIKELGV